MKPGNGLESPHIALVDVEKGINKKRSKFCCSFFLIRRDRENGSKRKEKTKTTHNDDVLHICGLLQGSHRTPTISFLSFFSVPAYPNWKYRLPTTSELAEQEQTLLRKPVKEGLNSVPTTQKEKAECAILLTPSQLFKVVVGKPI